MNLIFVAAIADSIRKAFTGIGGAFLSVIVKIAYALCTFIFSIMDILQLLIRKVAGLDKVYYTAMNDSVTPPESGDIAYNIIQNIIMGENSILTNVFWSMIILGAILLFLTTLVAILRSEYATLDSKSASKGQIVGQALKAIASFAVVPIVAVFGMYLANVILQAIDGATSVAVSSVAAEKYFEPGLLEDNSGNKSYTNFVLYSHYRTPTSGTPISGHIFAASAYKANRIRFYGPFKTAVKARDLGDGIFNNLSTDLNEAAGLLDTAFANGYTLKGNRVATLNGDLFKDDYLYPLPGDNFLSNKAPSFTSFDKNNISLVWYYYDLWSFDFIICIGALVVAAKLLIDLVFGLMKRLFELVVLFLIAAPISALMPLDNGAALGNWRKKFIAKAIGTYAPILGLNLLFIILPEFSKINFFNIPVVDKIVNVLFIIVGLLMIKDLVAMVAELAGGDDTLKSGGEMSGAIGGAAVSMAKTAVAPVGAGVKLAKGGTKIVKNAAESIKRSVQRHSDGRDIKAEEDYIKGTMDDETRSDFRNLSRGQRKDTLTRMRLNMSDNERTKALASEGRTGAAMTILKEKESQERYKNFNAKVFGEEGTKERASTERNIGKRRAEEQRRAEERDADKGEFKKGAKEIVGVLKDGLTSLTQHLGGEFAKAWKEGGGWKRVLSQSVGVNEKGHKENEAAKEQEKLLRAQIKAQEIVYGKESKGVAPAGTPMSDKSVKLDSASIDALAKAISEQVKK